jgi:hypothetical protein
MLEYALNWLYHNSSIEKKEKEDSENIFAIERWSFFKQCFSILQQFVFVCMCRKYWYFLDDLRGGVFQLAVFY